MLLAVMHSTHCVHFAAQLTGQIHSLIIWLWQVVQGVEEKGSLKAVISQYLYAFTFSGFLIFSFR